MKDTLLKSHFSIFPYALGWSYQQYCLHASLKLKIYSVGAEDLDGDELGLSPMVGGGTTFVGKEDGL